MCVCISVWSYSKPPGASYTPLIYTLQYVYCHLVAFEGSWAEITFWQLLRMLPVLSVFMVLLKCICLSYCAIFEYCAKTSSKILQMARCHTCRYCHLLGGIISFNMASFLMFFILKIFGIDLLNSKDKSIHFHIQLQLPIINIILKQYCGSKSILSLGKLCWNESRFLKAVWLRSELKTSFFQMRIICI